MKVQVSKVFAKFITKATGLAARVETLPERAYRFCTGVEPYDADYYGDYDWATGEYKAIVVTYPDGYYACPRYVTTKELHEEKGYRMDDIYWMEVKCININIGL